MGVFLVVACAVAALLAVGQVTLLLLPRARRIVGARRPPTNPSTRHVQGSRTKPRAVRRFGTVVRVAEGAALGLLVAATLAVGLVVFGPRLLPYQALVVRSGSMSPAIPTGSLVLYHKVPSSSVHPGQVILYNEPHDPGVSITHRVVRLVDTSSGRYFVTKGDANGTPDPWQVAARGAGWIVVWHVPDVGYALVALQSTPARLLLVTVPAFLLGALLLLETWMPGRPSATEAS